jgi:hypothetical protein
VINEMKRQEFLKISSLLSSGSILKVKEFDPNKNPNMLLSFIFKGIGLKMPHARPGAIFSISNV